MAMNRLCLPGFPFEIALVLLFSLASSDQSPLLSQLAVACPV